MQHTSTSFNPSHTLKQLCFLSISKHRCYNDVLFHGVPTYLRFVQFITHTLTTLFIVFLGISLMQWSLVRRCAAQFHFVHAAPHIQTTSFFIFFEISSHDTRHISTSFILPLPFEHLYFLCFWKHPWYNEPSSHNTLRYFHFVRFRLLLSSLSNTFLQWEISKS